MNNNKKVLSQGLNTILFLIWSTTNDLVQLSLVSTKKSQKKRKIMGKIPKTTEHGSNPDSAKMAP